MLSTLEKLGLSEKEAKVYLATLELAQDTVQNIAKKAGVNRPTTYFILENLMQIGLISKIEQGKKTKYIAVSPRQLKILIDRQNQELHEKSKELSSIMPQLEAIFNLSEHKPKVKYFEGYEGQIAMRKEAAQDTDKDIYSFISLDDLKEAFPKYDDVQERQRVERKTKSHVIYTSEQGTQQNRDDSKNLRISKFIPKDKFPFTGSFTVHPISGKVYISIYKETPLAIVITNQDIANMFFQIWKLAWEAASTYNK